MRLIPALYERLTGRPWTTSRQLSTDPALAHLGPPPAVRYAAELACYTDRELYERGPEILAELREREAAVARLLDAARETVAR